MPGRGPSPPATQESRHITKDKVSPPKGKIIGAGQIKFIKAVSPEGRQTLQGHKNGSPSLLSNANITRINNIKKSPIDDEADISDDEAESSNLKLMNHNNFNRPKLKTGAGRINTTRDHQRSSALIHNNETK